MYDGFIKSIVIDRGFGFISRNDGGNVFFHLSDLRPGLLFDEALVERRVQFDVVDSDKGPRAANVREAI